MSGRNCVSSCGRSIAIAVATATATAPATAIAVTTAALRVRTRARLRAASRGAPPTWAATGPNPLTTTGLMQHTPPSTARPPMIAARGEEVAGTGAAAPAGRREHEQPDAAGEQGEPCRHEASRHRAERSPPAERAEHGDAGDRARGHERGDGRGDDAGEDDDQEIHRRDT